MLLAAGCSFVHRRWNSPNANDLCAHTYRHNKLLIHRNEVSEEQAQFYTILFYNQNLILSTKTILSYY